MIGWPSVHAALPMTLLGMEISSQIQPCVMACPMSVFERDIICHPVSRPKGCPHTHSTVPSVCCKIIVMGLSPNSLLGRPCRICASADKRGDAEI